MVSNINYIYFIYLILHQWQYRNLCIILWGVIPEDLNIWSGMLLYLGNLIQCFIIFIPLFILLTAGLIKQNALESIVLGLIGSKYRWWIGKFITLMIMTAIYVFFLLSYHLQSPSVLFLGCNLGWNIFSKPLRFRYYQFKSDLCHEFAGNLLYLGLFFSGGAR